MQRGHAEALIPMVHGVVGAHRGLCGRSTASPRPSAPARSPACASRFPPGRAFALALHKPCVGVSTLAAIAAPHILEEDGQAVASAIDARHGQVYFQLFSARGRTMVDARCMPLREAARALGGGVVKIAGPAAPMLYEEARVGGRVLRHRRERPGARPSTGSPSSASSPTRTSRCPRPYYLKAADATPQTGGRIART